ncbi:MAG: hypothetical protein Q8Q52_07335 [Acidimicrobiia bacterium]|nr:hypothetical protein [Acidimicrobiia bacterium]
MKTDSQTKALARALVGVRNRGDCDRIEGMAKALYGETKWRFVGDRENNIGTIRVGSDPALGVVERIINSMDSMLDLGRALHPEDDPTTPMEAAHLWYGVPTGGLGEMTPDERRTLGVKIKVWLEESGEDRRPTVVWEDAGVGQHPSDMPGTLLSLNESNKVGQRWNMGTYGQGGAVTFGFSRRTVLVSRAHPSVLDGRDDLVGWTIVKEVETDPEKNILPTYMYLVGSDSEVLTLPPQVFPDLEHGVRVTGVAYDLQGWHGPFTTGLWQLLHAAVFEPVLPFLLTGRRAKERDYGSRIIIGNAARLNNPEGARGEIEVVYRDSTKLSLGDRYGEVVFNYWVVSRPERSRSTSDAAAGYVTPKTAVSMTLYGQRQDVESRTWIKNNAMLPFLFKNMVIQIQANGLTPIAKREIFATTRERATKSDLRTEIYEGLASELRRDEELKRLNHVEREKLLQRSTAASSERVRKRLAKFIHTKLKNLFRAGRSSTESGTDGGKVGKGGGTSPPRDTSDSHLHNVPRHLEITRKRMRVRQGSTCWTWVEIDAKNGYLPAHDDELTVEIDSPDSGVTLIMRSELLGGKTRWTFRAEPDAALGEVKVKASLLTAAGMLSDEAVIEVDKPDPGTRRTKGAEPETGPEVRWVFKENWDDHDGEMGPNRVGYVTEDQDETIIWVNRHYRPLEVALNQRGLTAEQVETRADRYQFPVAVGLWFHHVANKSADPQPSEEYREEEKARLADAVLLAADPDVDLALEESEED